MKPLEVEFAERAASEQNARLLGNLAAVAAMQNIGLEDSSFGRKNSREFRSRSGIKNVGIAVERTVDDLAEYHGVSVPQLVDFAAKGTVLDVGAGQSNFLSAFENSASQTIAVDIHQPHLDFQASKGHRTLKARADHMTSVESGSVRLLNASYSAPYWSTSEEEAGDTADEYLRVLEPGGIALVGRITHPTYHPVYEELIGYLHEGNTEAVTELVHERKAFYLQHQMGFVDTLFDRMTEEHTAAVVGNRHLDTVESLDTPEHMHVPNYLMIQRLG